ncbi:hypothetical protein [Psychrilyobacter atlanticus]|uniref:hypothetical protein n=1 Tax=Psychrilyobacter atlanticus TaxID=271091 RepID=UPI000400D687|nr:hypothetical protein [Psychrilyobacter atlanticus]
MIESSVIKLILIVALNMCFVWVWMKKESLRSFMPFKIIRKLEEKVSFKKIKKLISFIGNINIFWILNISYFLLIKFFEKELNLILGFSEGTTKDLIIESNILKSSYIYANSLGGVTKFLFDSGNFIGLFIGVTALMIPIYLYIIGFKSKSKRQLLLMLTKKGDMFYISFFIYIMLFFKIEKIFLVGAIGYLIFLLMEAVKWIMKIENSLYSFEGLDKLLKLQEEEEIVELYNATLNELYQGVKDNDASATDENKKLLLLLLRNNVISLKHTKSLIGLLYDLYDVAIKNQDDDVFRKISYLHIKIADYYYKNDDKEKFNRAFYGVTKVYDYYYKDGTDKFASKVIFGLDFDVLGLWKIYKENFEEGIKWYSQIFKVIVEGIKKSVKNDDFYFFEQFIRLIKYQFKYKKGLKKDYKLLETSIYFGALLYLREEKSKRENNRIQYKKIHKYIKYIEKILLKNSLIDLIELYEFIEEKEIATELDWENYFVPKFEIIGVTIWDGRETGEIKKLFFELLAKGSQFKRNEKILSDDEHLRRYFKNKNMKGIEKSIERVNNFKVKASGLLNDLENNKDKINITEESYKDVKGLLIEFEKDTEQKKKEKIIESEISLDKIKTMKEILKNILSTSRIVKMLNKFDKYLYKKEESPIESVGIIRYMEKEFFTEIYLGDRIEFIIEPLGKDQNERIERIIVNSLDKKSIKSGEKIEKTLEKIKGKPWVILTGIYIGDFFYDKKGSVKENIIIKSDLDEKYFEKYGEILEGIYKYNGVESPIYNLDSDKEGIYILDSNDIEGFIHYDSNDENEYDKNILKKFDDNVGYAYLKIIDTKDIIEVKGEEEVLKYRFLKGNGTPEEKLEKFRQRILISFVQKGELKLKEDAKVYKVEFNG